MRQATTLVLFGMLALAVAARAQVPPSPACLQLQSCVDQAVGVAVTSCVTANPSCDAGDTDRFAVAAGVLAQRAISIPGCDTKTSPSKAACIRCYRDAKLPLKARLDLKLFHHLLAHAAELVTAQEMAQCGSL